MKNFKLLIIGSTATWAIDQIYFKYFKEIGIETYLFEEHSKFTDYYEQSIINKVLFRTGLSSFIKKLQRQLIEYTDRLKPDVILVFKGMEILPETLKHLKSKNIFLVNYNPDNPFIFSGKGSGNKNITDSVALYDLHLTYNFEVQSQISAQFNIPAEIVPFGFDLGNEEYEMLGNEPEILKTCFIGNPDKHRAEFIEKISSEIPIDIYGNNWVKFIKGKNITIFPVQYGNECWKTLRRYRVQLNLMRIHNLDSHNMRTFEIPAAGGIMLAPKTHDHRLYFEDGKEVFLFEDINECKFKAKMLLELSQENAQKIRKAARERSFKSGYSYQSRAKYVLGLINKLKN